jgi:hypothetical protein
MYDIIASLIVVSEFKKQISKSKKLKKELEGSVNLSEVVTRLNNYLIKPNNQSKIIIKNLNTVFKVIFTAVELERLHQLSTGPSRDIIGELLNKRQIEETQSTPIEYSHSERDQVPSTSERDQVSSTSTT